MPRNLGLSFLIVAVSALFVFPFMPLMRKMMKWQLSLVGQEYDPSPEQIRRGNIAGVVVLVVFWVLIFLMAQSNSNNVQ